MYGCSLHCYTVTLFISVVSSPGSFYDPPEAPLPFPVRSKNDHLATRPIPMLPLPLPSTSAVAIPAGPRRCLCAAVPAAASLPLPLARCGGAVGGPEHSPLPKVAPSPLGLQPRATCDLSSAARRLRSPPPRLLPADLSPPPPPHHGASDPLHHLDLACPLRPAAGWSHSASPPRTSSPWSVEERSPLATGGATRWPANPALPPCLSPWGCDRDSFYCCLFYQACTRLVMEKYQQVCRISCRSSMQLTMMFFGFQGIFIFMLPICFVLPRPSPLRHQANRPRYFPSYLC